MTQEEIESHIIEEISQYINHFLTQRLFFFKYANLNLEI